MQLPPIPIVRRNGWALVFLEVYEEGGIVCGVRHLDGEIRERPKRWLRTVRAGMRLLERKARKAGCAEMRVAGRDWSRILPDYEPLPGVPNRLRKRL